MQQPRIFNLLRNFMNGGTYQPNDTAGDVTDKVKSDVIDFDGKFNATTFVD